MLRNRFREIGLFRISAELGGLNAALYLLARAFNRLFSERVRLIKYYFVTQRVAAHALLPPGRGVNIQVRRVSANDPIALKFPRPASVIRQRFDLGAECYAATKRGSLAGYLWLMHGRYPEDEVRTLFIPEPEGLAVWDFDVYVDPQDRFGFAFARLWDETNQVLRERGIRHTISRISAFNRGSLAAHTRLGAEIVGSATYLCVGPWQLMVATVAPFVHLSLHARSMPILRIGDRRSDAPDRSARSL